MYVDQRAFVEKTTRFISGGQINIPVTLNDFAGFWARTGPKTADYYAGFAAELTLMMESSRGKLITNAAEYFVNSAIARVLHYGGDQFTAEVAAAVVPRAGRGPNSADFLDGCNAARSVLVLLLHRHIDATDRGLKHVLYPMFVCAGILAREKTNAVSCYSAY